DRRSYIAREGIEADLGLRCVFMDHVDELLKQEEVAWVCSYARSDEDAIKPVLLELIPNDCLRSFAEVVQAHLHAVPETSQFVLRGPETGVYLRGVHARRVAGLREIDQVWIETHHENTPLP